MVELNSSEIGKLSNVRVYTNLGKLTESDAVLSAISKVWLLFSTSIAIGLVVKSFKWDKWKDCSDSSRSPSLDVNL